VSLSLTLATQINIWKRTRLANEVEPDYLWWRLVAPKKARLIRIQAKVLPHTHKENTKKHAKVFLYTFLFVCLSTW
jgi:hypothetical protein